MTSAGDDGTAAHAPPLTVADPASLDVDPERLGRAADAVADLPEARALLVARRSSLVLERYLDAVRGSASRNVKSVTKSVQSALVGIALDDGLLSGLDQPLAEILPAFGSEPLPDLDLGWAASIETSVALRRGVTVRDLLTMRTGFAGSDMDETYVTVLAHAPDQIAFAAHLPITGRPGSTFRYNTANAMLLNGVIATCSGMSPLDFAQERLFGPLGAHVDRWRTDQVGLEIGGAELDLTARDMLRLGLLYLGHGAIAGRRILPAAYVRESLTAFVTFSGPPRDAAAALLPDARGYGLMWWLRASGATEMWCAWGFGGQFVCLVPAAELVVAVHSSLGLNAAYQRRLLDIVDEQIVAPLLR